MNKNKHVSNKISISKDKASKSIYQKENAQFDLYYIWHIWNFVEVKKNFPFGNIDGETRLKLK